MPDTKKVIDANKWAEYDRCIAVEAQALTLTCLKSINNQKVWDKGVPTSALKDMSAAIERLQNVAFHAKANAEEAGLVVNIEAPPKSIVGFNLNPKGVKTTL